MAPEQSIIKDKEKIDKLLHETENIKEFCNESFRSIGELYGNVYPGVSDNWIEEPNFKSYLKKIQKNN